MTISNTNFVTTSSLKNDIYGSSSRHTVSYRLLRYLTVPLIAILLLSIISQNNNAFEQIFLAFVILLFPWISYLKWIDKGQQGLPIFSMLTGFMWIYYVLALFVGDRIAPVWYSDKLILSEQSVTNHLIMTLIAIMALALGMRIDLTRLIKLPSNVSAVFTEDKWNYIRILLVVSTFLSFFPTLVGILGEAGRQWILAFQITIPLLMSIMLIRKYLRGYATGIDKLLIVVYISSRILTGLASGWSGSIFFLGLAIGLVYFLERKSIPIRSLIVLFLLVLFIQPNKAEFRSAFWYSDNQETNLVIRTVFWLEGSLNSWQDALSDPTGEKLAEYLGYSLNRVTFLFNHSANVHERTPEIVPHQGLSLYRFAMAGLIPRFLWPDKPSANDANRFFQVAYNITPEDRLHTVSIAIGFLAESFIALSWMGVAIVMFFVGIIYNIINHVFLRNPDNVIATAIGIVVLVRLFDIESQLGRYLIVIIQTIVVSYLFLMPIISPRFTNQRI